MTMTNKNPPLGINLLDLPNKHINFDGPFFISCGHANAEYLLMHCQPYIRDWYIHHLSVHQFAEKWKNDGVTLWLAQDVERSELEQQEKIFAFYMAFNQQENDYVLIQCQLDYQEFLQ